MVSHHKASPGDIGGNLGMLPQHDVAHMLTCLVFPFVLNVGIFIDYLWSFVIFDSFLLAVLIKKCMTFIIDTKTSIIFFKKLMKMIIGNLYCQV